jgi:uncharacterized protein YjeT (DUF2065 family)
LFDLITALGLVLVIEGIVLAAAPGRLMNVLKRVAAMPPPVLRAAGLLAAAVGLFVVWLVRG